MFTWGLSIFFRQFAAWLGINELVPGWPEKIQPGEVTRKNEVLIKKHMEVS